MAGIADRLRPYRTLLTVIIVAGLFIASGLLAFHTTALRQLTARAASFGDDQLLKDLAAKQQALMAELAKIQLDQPAGLPVEEGTATNGSVPAVGSPAATAASAAPSESSSARLVALNKADQATLETLPDIGPSKAQAILEYRMAHGRFSSIDELDNVKGIGEATLAKLKPHLTLD